MLEFQFFAPATVESVTLEAKTSPGFICAVIASQKDQLIPEISTQIEVAATEFLLRLESQYVGTVLCE